MLSRPDRNIYQNTNNQEHVKSSKTEAPKLKKLINKTNMGTPANPITVNNGLDSK